MARDLIIKLGGYFLPNKKLCSDKKADKNPENYA
jgi:hypothetical protein